MQYEQLNPEADESIDIRQIVRKIIPYWPWFVLSILIAIVTAFIFIKSSTVYYISHATLLIKSNEQSMNLGSVLLNQTPKTNISNEAGIIQSINTKLHALEYIDNNISYYKKSRYNTVECYSQLPFTIKIDTTHQQPLNMAIFVSKIDNNLVHLKAENSNTPVGLVNRISTHNVANIYLDTIIELKQWLSCPNMSFMVDSISKFSEDLEFFFIINSISRQIGFYESLELNINKESSLLDISLQAQDPQKAIDLLNALIKSYLHLETNKKLEARTESIDFINELLIETSDTLHLYEQELTRFQTKHLTIGIGPKSNDLYAKYSELQSQLSRLSLQQRYYKHVANLLKEEKSLGDLISPQVLGINEPVVNDLVKQLIDLYTQKSEISFNTRKDNPYVNVIDEKITNLKSSLVMNINSNLDALKLSEQEHEEQLEKIESELSKLPQTNKQLTNYERKFKVIDDLYTFLLKRRSEARIEKAATRVLNEVIQHASPLTTETKAAKAIQVILISIILAIIIPILIIQLKSYLYNKLEDEEQIKKLTKLPFIGHVFNIKDSNKAVFSDMQSPEAECFRTIRSNTSFFTEKSNHKSILITSSQEGEGKSFVAYNLAAAFSQNKEKTIYLDFDLRKPSKNNLGISNYLVEKVSLDDIIYKVSEFFHTIESGSTPPNANELINRKTTKILFEELKKQYDIIIIDTPPLMPVSDASLLAVYSNMQIFITRLKHTSLDALRQTLTRTSFKTMLNAAILVNSTKSTNKYYYYKK